MMPRRHATTAIQACLLGAMLFALPGSVSGQGRTYVEFEPLGTVTVKPDHMTPVAFTFHVQSGYHINSSHPSTPELIPTRLGFSPPTDVVIAKVQYPAGQLTSFPFDPTEKLSVYSGDVVIRAVVISQPKATAGTYTVHGEFKYQACDNNSCYPPKKLPVQFDVKILPGARKGRARPNAQSPHIHN